ncbi:MAG: hypothetical protein QME62_04100, partial [Armatimonadota bacterium]|nr:hypothetical protein [Armatimonadota bacterium]
LFGEHRRMIPSRFIREIPPEMFITQDRQAAHAEVPASQLWASSTKYESPKPIFKIGDHVKHSLFGLGIIIDVKSDNKDTQVTVAFEEIGIKKLMLSFAPLEKVEV